MADELSTLSVAVGCSHITGWGMVSVGIIMSFGQNVIFGGSVSV